MAQIFLNFVEFFGKIDKIMCWRPAPKGNAESAPDQWPLQNGFRESLLFYSN